MPLRPESRPDLRYGRARKQLGVYGLMFALLLVPLIGIVGCAIDFARVVQYKSDLQNAVDEAALAGAVVLTAINDAPTAASAKSLATTYFNRAMLPVSLSVSQPTVTIDNSGSVKLPVSNNSALTVTVSASATISNTLFSLFVPTVAVSASGTAAQPLVNANVTAGHVNNQACDGDTLAVYSVPKSADGTTYDYSYAGLSALPSSAFTNVSQGQALPQVTVNQPLGVSLTNVSNTGCYYGPNAYGAPPGSINKFYSSLLSNGQEPSEYTNGTYPVTTVTTTTKTTNVTTSRFGGTTTTSSTNNQGITSVSMTPPGSTQTVTYPGSHPLTGGDLSSYTGLTSANCPQNGTATPVTTTQTSVNGSTTKTVTTTSTTTNYLCTTQYSSSQPGHSSIGDCSLYVQTNVSTSYVSGLNSSSQAPAASQGVCASLTGGGAQYAAPTCGQLSTMANNGYAPAAVFWWNDGGGSSDDYDYNDAYFPLQCVTTGGTSSGYTEVLLTQ